MPRLLHFPWLRRLLGRGVNTDIRPELMPDGMAREMINGRPTSVGGNTGGVEAVHGEVLEWGAQNPFYVCIGSESCNGKVVEFWAASNFDYDTNTNPPVVKIDGVIVAQSRNIPYVYNRPLQIAVAEDLVGTTIAENQPNAGADVFGRGVLYPADHNSDPLYWSVRELLELFSLFGTAGPYFDPSYTTEQNSVQLLTNPEFPVFQGLYESEPGLPPGQVQYRLRWKTPQGDATNPGPETPLISIPLWQDRKLVWEQDVYPGVSTVGGPVTSPLINTGYGTRLQFRVDNQQGYQYVEVIRRSFFGGIDVGVVEIVGRIELAPGEVSIRTFLDPGSAIDPPEVIPPDQVEQRLISITKPKSAEYSDLRLTYANFETLSPVPEVEFDLIDGQAFVPVTQGVHTWYTCQDINDPLYGQRIPYNDGYSDPVNNTYLKSFTRGEQFGLGLMFWDGYTNRSFVAEIPGAGDGYTFPNRRDPKTGLSLSLSSDPCWAASTDVDPATSVQATFEAFTQGQRSKWPLGSFGSGYPDANMTVGGAVEAIPYGPTNPVNSGIDGMNNQTRLSLSPIVGVSTNSPNANALVIDNGIANSGPLVMISAGFSGRVWAPMHHALGAVIHGISGWTDRTKVITVMRTEPASKVVAQGIATYYLRDRDTSSTVGAKKYKNWVVVNFPDFISGLVPLNVQDELISNPQNFALQFVSPLGIYTEPYSFGGMEAPQDYGPSTGVVTKAGDYGASLYFGGYNDMVSFAGVQYDEGQVNKGEPTSTTNDPLSPGMAYQNDPLLNAAPNSNYMGYGAWRGQVPGTHAFSTDGGNKLFDIADVNQYALSGLRALAIRTVDDIYLSEDLDDSYAFGDTETRNWHEPVYTVNLVRRDAAIPDNTIDRYISTGCHIKVSSCIGEYQTGQPNYPLLNERTEDVFSTTGENRYIYITQNGVEQLWACATLNTEINANIAAVVAAINTPAGYTMLDGTVINGIYEIEIAEYASSGLQDPWVTIIMDGDYGGWVVPTPLSGSRIVVKFNGKNVKFFGGDCTISPSTSIVIDGVSTSPDDPYSTNPFWGLDGFQNTLSATIRLPYTGWQKNPFYAAPVRAIPSPVFSSDYMGAVTALRQWAMHWMAENRSALRYGKGTVEAGGPYEWPKMGYLIKPYVYDSNNYLNGLYSYPLVPVDGVDVDPRLTRWGHGGILYADDYNKDYAQQQVVSGFGIPFDDIGTQQVRTYFPTGVIASLENDTLLTDVPGLRTFIDQNLKALSEENGEIKVIASMLANGSRNMYAIAERGVARILTNKSILTGASGEVVSTQSISNYWGPEMWITRNIGSPDQMWQMFVKGFAQMASGYGDTFFWADRNSLYKMTGDTIEDIGRQRFLSFALPYLRNYTTDYVPGVNGFFNRKYNEAWMTIPSDRATPPSPSIALVFSSEVDNWIGHFTYLFDSYTQVGNQIYGHRDFQTFKVDEPGEYGVNGATRQTTITVPMVGEVESFKEMMRWRIIGSRPDKIQVLDPDFVVMCEMPAASVTNGLWCKEYDGWEGWADRCLATYDPARRLPQRMYFYLRLVWNTEGDKVVTAMSGQMKPLK